MKQVFYIVKTNDPKAFKKGEPFGFEKVDGPFLAPEYSDARLNDLLTKNPKETYFIQPAWVKK